MAVAFGTATTAAGTGFSASITINVPASTADGDLLLLVVSNNNPLDYINPPGWSRLEGATYSGWGTTVLWWRIASSEPASYTVTRLGDPGAFHTATMLRYTGASGIRDSTSVSNASGDSLTSSAPVAPTGIVGTDMVVHVYGWYSTGTNSGATLTPPSSPWTSRAAFTTTVAASTNNGLAVVDALGSTATPATSSSASGRWSVVSVALIEGTPASRVATDLTVVGSSAWTTSAASGATVAPSYPASLAQDDVVYAVVHIKPSTATVTTPANWLLVGWADAETTAAQGAGTGPTAVSVFKRVVPSGGLSGTETFSLATSPNVTQACMIAFRASGTNLGYDETWGYWAVPTSGTTAATNVSGTLTGGPNSGNLSLAAKDYMLAVIAPTDDATSPSVTAVAATGATFGSITADPATHGSSTTGNDISTGLFRVPITAGSSSTTPTITASLATAETMVGFAWAARATVDVAATYVPPAVQVVNQAALTRSNSW